jgi:hypothetical protein
VGVPGRRGGDWFYHPPTNEIIVDFTCEGCGNHVIMAVLVPPSMSLLYIGPKQETRPSHGKEHGGEVQ